MDERRLASVTLLVGATIAFGCAGVTASVVAPSSVNVPASAAGASATARSSAGGSPSATHTSSAAAGDRSGVVVLPLDLDTLERLGGDAFPCPRVDKDDPDYIPCDGGTPARSRRR